METAYFSLVRSSLEYSAVWNIFRQKYIDKLEKIQRSAARCVAQNYRQTANVTSLMFKIFNELVKISINDCLIPTDR